jgi:RimJ/RimL family protein N-acetyltransferase/aminoglycoside phosphotransferase (APT) family kinase protein
MTIEIAFRRLQRDDLPLLARWQARPHIARWWGEPANLAAITAKYMPRIEGADPTEMFIIEVEGAPAGVIQRYRMADYPDWVAAIGCGDAAGIDYYLGDQSLTGRGLGSRAIAAFARDTLARYPDLPLVIAAPQQDNVASWRALEKAGFSRLWEGQPDSDDPSDSGPAYVYGLYHMSGSQKRASGANPRPRVDRWRHPNHRELASLPAELRRPVVPPRVRVWAETATGATIVRVRRLAGASSTAVHAVYLANGRRLVLRRYAWPGFLAAEPIAPRREFDALRFAFARGLPVPEVIAADLSGQDVGDGVPVLLMTYIAGRPLADPDSHRLAELAAAIHDVDATALGHDYFPWYQRTMTAAPSASTRPALWERAVELWHTAMPGYRPTLIHRDFHPGNVHWLRNKPSGIVDWPNACRGPRGCDVATCRGNLIDLVGADAAVRFVAAYCEVTGEEYHPYWEMASILESDPADLTRPLLDTLEPRLECALRSLGVDHAAHA